MAEVGGGFNSIIALGLRRFSGVRAWVVHRDRLHRCNGTFKISDSYGLRYTFGTRFLRRITFNSLNLRRNLRSRKPSFSNFAQIRRIEASFAPKSEIWQAFQKLFCADSDNRGYFCAENPRW